MEERRESTSEEEVSPSPPSEFCYPMGVVHDCIEHLVLEDLEGLHRVPRFHAIISDHMRIWKDVGVIHLNPWEEKVRMEAGKMIMTTADKIATIVSTLRPEHDLYRLDKTHPLFEPVNHLEELLSYYNTRVIRICQKHDMVVPPTPLFRLAGYHPRKRFSSSFFEGQYEW